MDLKSQGYQCITEPNIKSFKTWKQGQEVGLKCASPQETEDFLKACKQQHQVLPITLCHYIPDGFTCVDPDGHQFPLDWNAADNYFCMDDQDWKRTRERCGST